MEPVLNVLFDNQLNVFESIIKRMCYASNLITEVNFTILLIKILNLTLFSLTSSEVIYFLTW